VPRKETIDKTVPLPDGGGVDAVLCHDQELDNEKRCDKSAECHCIFVYISIHAEDKYSKITDVIPTLPFLTASFAS